jgi:hypothetical protein
MFFGCLSLISSAKVSAATKTWVGSDASDVNWSTASNWSPAGAPSDGDALVFDCDTEAECVTIFDMPGLEVSSVSFIGAARATVNNPGGAPIYVGGNINSVNAGSVFVANLVLSSNVTVNNVVLGEVDLNGHELTLGGKGVVNPTNNERWIGFSGDINGDGVVNINADADQEVYLAGDNTYSGKTNVNGGKFVSNGQSTDNATMDMFGVSDVNVGPLGKVVFTFKEAEAGFSFDNLLTFERLDPLLAQLLAVNKTSNGASVSVTFSNIELKSASRFDVDVTSGGLLVNLDGVVANSYCIEYGKDNTQSSYFQNGPICVGDKEVDGGATSQTPLKPKTGVVASSVIVVAVGSIIALTSYQIRKGKKMDSINNEK